MGFSLAHRALDLVLEFIEDFCQRTFFNNFFRVIADAVNTLARKDKTEVILIGASREGLLQQAIKGNIPEAIARKSPCTVILFRGSNAGEHPL
jgi:hypothetical protein